MNVASAWDCKICKERKCVSGWNAHGDGGIEGNKEGGFGQEWVVKALACNLPCSSQMAQNIRRFFSFGGFIFCDFYFWTHFQSSSNDCSYSRLQRPGVPTRCSWGTPWCSGGAVEKTASAFKCSTAPCGQLYSTGTSTASLFQCSQLGRVLRLCKDAGYQRGFFFFFYFILAVWVL